VIDRVPDVSRQRGRVEKDSGKNSCRTTTRSVDGLIIQSIFTIAEDDFPVRPGVRMLRRDSANDRNDVRWPDIVSARRKRVTESHRNRRIRRVTNVTEHITELRFTDWFPRLGCLRRRARKSQPKQ
jgi:hypothetical protein